MNDILFGPTNNTLCEESSSFMSKKFKMSMVDELTFFPGLQIKQYMDGIFIDQIKYSNELLKKIQNGPSQTCQNPNGY